MFFVLRNLVATDVALTESPWELCGDVPDAARQKKTVRTQWITDPETRHSVYSLVEGVNPNGRVTGAGRAASEDANPPHAIHGIAADYDARLSLADVEAGIARLAHKPQWYERTLSGNARLVWLFEAPVLVAGYAFASGFQKFVGEQLKLSLALPALDAGALADPARYFTTDSEGAWKRLDNPRLPADLVRGWWVQFSDSFKYVGPEFGETSIPLEVIAAELARKYPRFAEWPGEFAVGAMGPSFFVDGSTSPKSATIRENGITTFAAHASKPWYSWADLLGAQFVSDYAATSIGRAVEGLYFDGKSYLRQIADGRWKAFDKSDASAFLKVSRGLSSKPDKRGVSAIDRALQHVQDHQFVGGAAPFVFRPPGPLRFNGDVVLNTSTRVALAPAATAAPEWGPNGKFPRLSQFLDHLFDPRDQLVPFLGWLAHAYRGAHQRKPRFGQNVFIAGGQGVGKTWLNTKIIGTLLGGSADALDYMLGEDKFGSELFASGHWAVDDSRMTSSAAQHRLFSEVVKRLAANSTFRWHEKFRVPVLVEWVGRVVVTLNLDEESARIIPDLTISIRDKLCLFRTIADLSQTPFRFGDSEANDALLEAELPEFAAWLLRTFVIPPEWIDTENPRFGVRCHHDESLVATASQSSSLHAFAEILDDWRTGYFKAGTGSWSGTSYQLHKLLHADPSAAPALRNFSVDAVGRALAGLRTRGDAGITVADADNLRVWTITPKPGSAAEAEPVRDIPAGGKFDKAEHE